MKKILEQLDRNLEQQNKLLNMIILNQEQMLYPMHIVHHPTTEPSTIN